MNNMIDSKAVQHFRCACYFCCRLLLELAHLMYEIGAHILYSKLSLWLDFTTLPSIIISIMFVVVYQQLSNVSFSLLIVITYFARDHLSIKYSEPAGRWVAQLSNWIWDYVRWSIRADHWFISLDSIGDARSSWTHGWNGQTWPSSEFNITCPHIRNFTWWRSDVWPCFILTSIFKAVITFTLRVFLEIQGTQGCQVREDTW